MGSWERCLAYTERFPVPDAERREARDAVTHLRDLLGDDWGGWAEGRPLAYELLRAYGDGRPEVVRLVRLLRHLESDPYFGDILTDLGNAGREKYVGAVNVLAVAGSLRSHGCAVELIPRDPPRKTPDFRADLAGRWVTFEAMALQPSKSKQDADTIRDSLVGWARSKGIADSWFVKIDWPVPVGEALSQLEELKKRIEDAVRKGADAQISSVGPGTVRVFRGQGPIPILVNGLVTDSFRGVADQNEMKRVLCRIREKYDQVKAVDGPTVIILRNDELLVPAHIRDMESAIQDVASRIVGALPVLPHAGAVLDYEEWVAECPASIVLRGDSYCATVDRASDGFCRAAILASNPAAHAPLTTSEIGALIGLAMRW
jgi:hypothetical protein